MRYLHLQNDSANTASPVLWLNLPGAGVQDVYAEVVLSWDHLAQLPDENDAPSLLFFWMDTWADHLGPTPSTDMLADSALIYESDGPPRGLYYEIYAGNGTSNVVANSGNNIVDDELVTVSFRLHYTGLVSGNQTWQLDVSVNGVATTTVHGWAGASAVDKTHVRAISLNALAAHHDTNYVVHSMRVGTAASTWDILDDDYTATADLSSWSGTFVGGDGVLEIATPFVMPDVRNLDEAVAGDMLRAALIAHGIDPATQPVLLNASASPGYSDEDNLGEDAYASSRGPDGSVSHQHPGPGDTASEEAFIDNASDSSGSGLFDFDVWGVIEPTSDPYFLVTTAALWGTDDVHRLWHGAPPGSPPPVTTTTTASPRRGRGWRFLLVRTSDMSLIGEMKNAHDRQLSVDLNKSGSASGWLPTSDPLAQKVRPWKTAVVAQYEDTWYWSGPVKSRQLSFAQGRLTFNAVGWYERLMSFLIQDQQVVYTAADAGFIAADLLDRARAQDARLPITLGSVAVTQNRTITYQRNQNIGQAISDLVALESGFDWYIDPVTRAFHIVERIGRTRPECKWLFIADDVRGESNLSEVVEDEDGGTVVNWISPIGQAHQLTPQIDPDSIDELEGVFMEAPSLSDVVDDNVLLAYAAGELVYRALPRVTYTMTPKSSSKGSVPRIFREFDLGDTTYLTARRDGFSVVNQGERIFGVTLSIQDNGSELLTNLQTTAG